MRSLASQVFTGYRLRETRVRRRRRHFKFFGKILSDVLSHSIRGGDEDGYSVKNERVRWGYNLAKFKKRRVFYYKLSSRIFFRKYFGFSNNTKVGNFQAPLRKSPTGFLRFFNVYRKKPYTFVRSLRWLKSNFSFSNMRLAKYLVFISCDRIDPIFRSLQFWKRKAKVNISASRYKTQDLFIFTQPVARSAYYSELDFFKKKMSTTFRPNVLASAWFRNSINNFKEVANKFSKSYALSARKPYEKFDKVQEPVFRKSDVNTPEGETYIKKDLIKKQHQQVSTQNTNKYSFSFFFKSISKELTANIKNYKTLFLDNRIKKTSRLASYYYLLSFFEKIKNKILDLKTFSVKKKILAVKIRMQKNRDIKNILFSKKIPIVSGSAVGAILHNNRLYSKKSPEVAVNPKTRFLKNNLSHKKKVKIWQLGFFKKIKFVQNQNKLIVSTVSNIKKKKFFFK